MQTANDGATARCRQSTPIATTDLRDESCVKSAGGTTNDNTNELSHASSTGNFPHNEAPKLSDDLIDLNVSGTVFTLPLMLIKQYPQTILGRMFSTSLRSGHTLWTNERDANGRVLLHCDAQIFALVVTFLRTGRCSLSPEMHVRLNDVMAQVQYLQFDAMEKFLRQHYIPHPPADVVYCYVGPDRTGFALNRKILTYFFPKSLLACMAEHNERHDLARIELSFPERDPSTFVLIYNALQACCMPQLDPTTADSSRDARLTNIAEELNEMLIENRALDPWQLKCFIADCRFYWLEPFAYKAERAYLLLQLEPGGQPGDARLKRFTRFQTTPELSSAHYMLSPNKLCLLQNLSISTAAKPTEASKNVSEVDAEPFLFCQLDWRQQFRISRALFEFGNFACAVEYTPCEQFSSKNDFNLANVRFLTDAEFDSLAAATQQPYDELNTMQHRRITPTSSVCVEKSEKRPNKTEKRVPKYLHVILRMHSLPFGADGYEKLFVRNVQEWDDLCCEVEALMGPQSLKRMLTKNEDADFVADD